MRPTTWPSAPALTALPSAPALARLLATPLATPLIMLSATPHDGKPESFASLMNMLDPTAIANPSDYAHEDFRDKGLVIRRFKKDVRDQLGDFPDREIARHHAPASRERRARLRRARWNVTFHTLDGKRTAGSGLFRTRLEKTPFSSPAPASPPSRTAWPGCRSRSEAPSAMPISRASKA
ncbi:MAG: hypothetical protein U5L98_09145 [Halomonas sp.]|uniref:hypothetical protein n=1 Tax=Halomonas sp. TaxID=1486246 RepID=UPI002ACE86A3|nr:hypothetical protein [Halomonas sp.]MDZ7852788.1 hypothetical protein [Halomonas sp.]